MIWDLLRGNARSIACFLLVVSAAVIPIAPANAGPQVSCEIKVVARHSVLVTFTWEIAVESKKSWDACDLVISFEDESGREIHMLRETLSIPAGRSTFSGHDLCEADLWNKIRKTVTTLDCVF